MGEGGDVADIKLALGRDVSLWHLVAIGSFGKHLSCGTTDGTDQLGQFIAFKSRGVKTVTIMWNGELGALTSALSAAKLVAGIGSQVRIALLPSNKDSNEVTPDIILDAFFKLKYGLSHLI